MSNHIFISHTTADDDFVKQLREALNARALTVWDDAQYLRGGDELWPEVKAAIEAANHFIVVFSQQAFQSEWVYKEVQLAVEIEKQRRAARDDSFRVIALRLDDIELGAFRWVFGEQRAIVPVSSKPGALAEKMPAILAALGLELPSDASSPAGIEEKPVAELLLELRNLKVETEEGKTRAKAEARLIYQPPGDGAREVKSNPFFFTSPLGPIENDDLRWYLEKYYQWPVGQFKARGERIAKQLPDWGKLLYKAALETNAAQEPLRAWLDASNKAERRFSVEVSDKLPEGSPAEAVTSAKEAATLLLSLPWELLHDDLGYLFHGKDAIRVRRRLPNSFKFDDVARELPIRVLLVSPRPEDDKAEYIDHRVSSKPLVEAIEALGDLVNLTILPTPTFAAMNEALKREQFDVVHFDGHGVFDPRVGLGKLCFEAPDQDNQLVNRRSELIDADKLADVMRAHRIPLVFLEACQSAKTDEDPTASVAAKLLEQGVVSVVAMTHSVLVETARRFVAAFYRELANGARVGAAMLAGQQALHADTRRGAIAGAGEFHLQDWFVPVLYQERQDPPLLRQRLSAGALEDVAVRRKFNLGELPDPPDHTFIGRSRELLALERMLLNEPYAVIRGVGGEGKTTLAVELARWMLQTNRFRRAAFVSLEQYSDAKGAADTIGRQLVGAGYTASMYNDWREALLPIARELKDKPTIIVVDNVESLFVVPPLGGSLSDDAPSETEVSGAPSQPPKGGTTNDTGDIFLLCQALLDAHPATRIVFTSREHLPKPFANRDRVIPLDRLSREDAVELVSRVLHRREYDEQGNTPADIAELVEAVNRHARALTLLAREANLSGVSATTETLRPLMAKMEQQHPGDRENSLYASVELSLRRLPPDLREQAKALAVFHGGAHLYVIGQILEADAETVQRLAAALIEVGLAEEMPYGHLRLDPALPPYLLRELSEVEQEQMRQRWAESMLHLTGVLYDLQFKDAGIAACLALFELRNLISLLGWVHGKFSQETELELACNIEDLIARLGRPRELSQVVFSRGKAVQSLKGWCHAKFLAESADIDRSLDKGDPEIANELAQQLLQMCLDAGEEGYQGADYDIALAYLRVGKVQRHKMNTGEALKFLNEARIRFQALSDKGNVRADRMTAIAIAETGDCLRDLRRLEEAAQAYGDASARAMRIGDKRQVIAVKGQLGTIYLLQKRYADALEKYVEVLKLCDELGEPSSAGEIWYQLGILYSEVEKYDEAERAYKASLAIAVNQRIPLLEADCLDGLGIVYAGMSRLEDAVAFHRQAAERHKVKDNLSGEGRVRNNLAYTLIKLGRYDEARPEVLRSIQCKESLSYSAEPWTTWDMLCQIERATGDKEKAEDARQRAIQSFLAHRRSGGTSENSSAQLCLQITQAILQEATIQMEQRLAHLSSINTSIPAKALLTKLHAILCGNRDTKLIIDLNLHYADAAELILLLEALDGKESSDVEKG